MRIYISFSEMKLILEKIRSDKSDEADKLRNKIVKFLSKEK